MVQDNIEKRGGIQVNYRIDKADLLDFINLQIKNYILNLDQYEVKELQIDVLSLDVKDLLWNAKVWHVNAVIGLKLFRDGWLVDVDTRVSFDTDIRIQFIKDQGRLIDFKIQKYSWIEAPSITIAKVDVNVESLVNYFLEKKMPEIIEGLNIKFNQQLKAILKPSYLSHLAAQKYDFNGDKFFLSPSITSIRIAEFEKVGRSLVSNIFANGVLFLSTTIPFVQSVDQNQCVFWNSDIDEFPSLLLKVKIGFETITRMINGLLPVLDIPALGKLKLKTKNLQASGNVISLMLTTSGATNGEFKLLGKLVHDLDGKIGIKVHDIKIIKLSSFKKMAFAMVKEKVKREINQKVIVHTSFLQKIANDQLNKLSTILTDQYFVYSNFELSKLKILRVEGSDGHLLLDVKAVNDFQIDIKDQRFYEQFSLSV